MKTVFREGRSGDAEFKGAQTAGANVHGGDPGVGGKDNGSPAR